MQANTILAEGLSIPMILTIFECQYLLSMKFRTLGLKFHG
jgi:hypothetical protein